MAPPAVLAAMTEGDLTARSGSTFFLQSLLDDPSFGRDHLARMTYLGLGGSTMPASFADRAEALGIPIARSLGSTEHPSTTGSSRETPRAKRNYTDGRRRRRRLVREWRHRHARRRRLLDHHDRKKDVIVRGGENVSALVRVASSGSAPDLEAMRTHLDSAGLARQKWPEELRIVDELPRTPSARSRSSCCAIALRSETHAFC
ncbi:MAG TPA: hypothetical protein VF441_09300 [Acidimicrobiia bacterium]